MENNKFIKINPIKLIVGGFIVLALGLLVYSLYEIFRPNPYGNEIKIDNFAEYFGDTPRDEKDGLFAGLYNIVADNAEANGLNEIPKSGAMIRDGSAANEYNETENLHVGKFIVDIESIGQSYAGYFEWSNDNNNAYFSGYTMLYTCLVKEDLIFGQFKCNDMFADSVTTKFPITQYLPDVVDYFSDDYADHTNYRLTYQLNEDETEITLIITDYTGGNYQNALDRIKSFGYNPEDYTIEYVDESVENDWPHA